MVTERYCHFDEGIGIALFAGHRDALFIIEVEGGGIERRADAVQNELAAVDVFHHVALVPFLFVLIHIAVGKVELCRVRFRSGGADPVQLVVRLVGGVGIGELFGHGHRIIDIGRSHVRVKRICRISGNEHGIRTRRGVDGMDLGIGGIDVQQIDGPLRLHVAVGGGVVRKLNVVPFHHFRTVQLGAAEVEIGGLYLTFDVLVPVRGSVVNVIAVDEDARRIVLRDDEFGKDDVRLRIGALGEVVRRDAHERALDHFAVGIVRRVILRSVDEVVPVILFDDKAAVGLRGAVCGFVPGERIPLDGCVAACKRPRGKGKRHQQQHEFFSVFQHKD